MNSKLILVEVAAYVYCYVSVSWTYQFCFNPDNCALISYSVGKYKCFVQMDP